MEIRIVSHMLNPLAIDPIAQAIPIPGAERVIVLGELTNQTDQVIVGACVIAVGYAHLGGIVALTQVGPWVMFPHQIRPFELNLVPLKDSLQAVRLFPLVDATGR